MGDLDPLARAEDVWGTDESSVHASRFDRTGNEHVFDELASEHSPSFFETENRILVGNHERPEEGGGIRGENPLHCIVKLALDCASKETPGME